MREHLTFIRTTNWEEVFSGWKELEKGVWDGHFMEQGYATWDAWRGKMVAPIAPEAREWSLYQITNPFDAIPEFWIGGFRGWRRYLPEGVRRIQFKDLVKSPRIKENPKIMSVYESFPKKTTLLGIRLGEEVILGEGMHRSSAIALAAAEGKRFETEISIALTDFSEDERALFERCRTQQDTGTFLDDLRTDKM